MNTRPIIPFAPGELERLVAAEWRIVARGMRRDARYEVDDDGFLDVRGSDDTPTNAKALRALLDALEDGHLVEVDRDSGRVLGWAAAVVHDHGRFRRLRDLHLHDSAREAWSSARLDERMARITPERNARREAAMASAQAAAASWEQEQRRRTAR